MLIYVGKYYSDILFVQENFDGAITLYNSDTMPKGYFYSSYMESFENPDIGLRDAKFAEFVEKQIIKYNLLEKCHFLFYDFRVAQYIIDNNEEIRQYIIGHDVLYYNWLNNKTSSRLWLSDYVKIPDIGVFGAKECSFNNLKNKFSNSEQFIIQDEFSSGGRGTFIAANNKFETKHLCDNRHYIVSPLLSPSKSFNAHIAVSSNEVVIFPVSKQIIITKNGCLIYSGSIFKNKYQTNFAYKFLSVIGGKLKNIGFRGVCGIDFLVCKEDYYFIEINNRLQGSSLALDMILSKMNLPSIYEYLFNSLTDKTLKQFDLIYSLPVECSYNFHVATTNDDAILKEENNVITIKEGQNFRCLSY